MSESNETTVARILNRAELTETHLGNVIGQLMQRQIDAADLYFQMSEREHWTLEDGVVRDAGYARHQGVGVRAIAGEKTGFAYSDDVAMDALLNASSAARAITRQGQNASAPQLQSRLVRPLYGASSPLRTISDERKTATLKALDARIRELDPRVEQVTLSLMANHDDILVAAADGTLCADSRPLVRFNATVIVRDGDRREQGYAGGGGRFGLDALIDMERGMEIGREAVRQALVALDAVPSPAGPMPVVLGPGWPAVLLHEAVGHGLEGDFNRKGTSVFSGKIGERVTSPLCTIVDDGTIPDRRGSLSVDDEGVESQCTVLIENGILKGYLQDKHNARLMGTRSTGNGRRESFAHTPMPRMTNTYMRNGKHDPDEIIGSVKRGLYAPNFGGGQVDITSGNFVFSASEAYLIEDGKIGAPVRGATLIGNGLDAMNQISMVGNDMKLDNGVGVCGKEGQAVPVGVGQPTVLLDEITVGGTGG
ncbi:MAG: metalloprotease TldD [Pseudomonadota bacterium]